MASYVDACLRQMERDRARGLLVPASSVFFGGGTPSRLDPQELCRLLDAIERVAGAEVTVECNPEDADPERFVRYRAAGVTRISVGIQSTHDHVLASLGRVQVADALGRVSAAVEAAGFPTWNVDLVFGAAAESDADWQDALHEVVGLAHPPPHVSAYALTVEPGTALASDPARHPDEDVQARRYLTAERILSGAGYTWEEISNWARPGHECRHNGLYWAQGDYLGVGSAAHSHVDGHRWWNVRTPERYVDAVLAGRSPVAGEERLDPAKRAFEQLALALRTPAGVPTGALAATEELQGLVERRGERAVLTVRGRLLAGALSTRLAADVR
jgi:oxygen-independent coproporphyrinogen-3 oxidase